MNAYVLELDQLDRTQTAIVGGKAANLGELLRIPGIHVPPGFCVTANAFQRVVAGARLVEELLDRLSVLSADDRASIRTISADLRRAIEAAPIPSDVTAAVTRALTHLGADSAYAVRSSATAEDLPAASFAGQQDTFLNVTGSASILRHINRCWASLFTVRAVLYRQRNGFDHRGISMGVVVQRMVPADASGVLFTADPLTGNRKVVSIEAAPGLGEALVSGHLDPDRYKVRDDVMIERIVRRDDSPTLTDAQALQLARVGRSIEAHFGWPQDIEWCLAGDRFQIVQSRPITTLFPVPQTTDEDNHVYVSVGHQQMMTDAMKPLGISVWQMTAARPMLEAGGRLFVDVTRILASPTLRATFLEGFQKADPLITDALQNLLDRGDFITSLPADGNAEPTAPAPPRIENDPAIVAALIARSESSIADLERAIGMKSGSALFDFILEDFKELKRILFDAQSHQVIMAAMEAYWSLNDLIRERLGEKNAADTLTQSVPHNITSEMGLKLLDVADVIRPHRDVVVFLRQAQDDDFINELPTLGDAGRQTYEAITAWLKKYGMRGVGEIDITRPRWSERPTLLLPLILRHVDNFSAGEAQRRFEAGRRAASQKEREVLDRMRALPDGERKAAEIKELIERVRTFTGFREYPKYAIVSRHFIYKRALLKEVDVLVKSEVLRETEDAFFLTFEELRDVVRVQHADWQTIDARKRAFRAYQLLHPPRVLTSDGEAIASAYRREDIPAGALVGLPVSAGTVEGRARVILDIGQADLQDGDILVTTYTDPSWTPLFVSIAGLVTEVGGLMTHGAVIAREYGLPAVVGVENATRLIENGQRIRVHGTDGYVEILG